MIAATWRKTHPERATWEKKRKKITANGVLGKEGRERSEEEEEEEIWEKERDLEMREIW